MLGSEFNTECSSSSLQTADIMLLVLTALRRAEEAREAAVLVSTSIWGEEEGEEVVEASASAFWRASFLAARTWRSDRGRARGVSDSWMVRKATLAAWRSASMVELSRIEVRAGEEGEESDSCKKGRVGERRDLYFSIPSSSQQTLTLVLGTLGATTAWVLLLC